MNTPTRRDLLRSGAATFGLGSLPSVAAAIRRPGDDPLDALAEVDEATSQATHRAHRDAGYACRSAYCELVRAAVGRAGIEPVSRADYASAGRPLATVKTARRAYVILPDAYGEWNCDQDVPGWGLGFEVVAIDL